MKKNNFEQRLTALEKITPIARQDNSELEALLDVMDMVDALSLARIAERIVEEGTPLNDRENEAIELIAEKYSAAPDLPRQ